MSAERPEVAAAVRAYDAVIPDFHSAVGGREKLGAAARVLWSTRAKRELGVVLDDFQPDLVQITGPSDVGTLGAMLAHRFQVPLAASWQTNLHQYARSRLSRVASRLPATVRSPNVSNMAWRISRSDGTSVSAPARPS